MARPHDRKPPHRDDSPTNDRQQRRTGERLHQDTYAAKEHGLVVEETRLYELDVYKFSSTSHDGTGTL